MDRNQMIDVYEAALTAWLGRDGRSRLEAVVPGAGLEKLVSRLRASPQGDWPRLFAEHGCQRAEDICFCYKPGDLWNQDGEYLWNMYYSEFDNALRIATKSPRVARLRMYEITMTAARTAFTSTAERLRDQLTGYTAAQRKALDEARVEIGLERSETLREAYERATGEESKP